ncbi:hypothetical protein D0869_03255, partial [Hortaea werneckii]
ENVAFVLGTDRKFVYERRQAPVLESSRDVVVQVVATGLCGSDIHYWQHGQVGPYKVEEPLVLGHDSSGIVVSCGPEVRGLKVGDRVAMEPGISCNHCDSCRKGRYNLCSHMRFAATPPHNGTLATYYCLPQECCFLLPQDISLRDGALVEPLGIAVHACRQAGDMQGQSMVIFGAGPIGQLCCSVARALGASKVVVTDVVEERLTFALGKGATAVHRMSPGADSSESVAELKKLEGLEHGASIVMDATGVEGCINCGIALLKRGGTFVQVGLGARQLSLPVGDICDKEATFKGSFRYGPGDFQLAISLMTDKRVNLDDMVTHCFPFESAQQAFENVVGRQGIKSVILGPGVDIRDGY